MGHAKLALTRDFQQAEDVVQEALLAAWTALPTLAEPARFPGWLRGIVRHHALHVLRCKGVRYGGDRGQCRTHAVVRAGAGLGSALIVLQATRWHAAPTAPPPPCRAR